MAANRLEKIGTIYTRTKGLMQSKALAWNDRPLWYDIYKAFPPHEVPSFDRPAPNVQIRKIFYKEDKIRALFQKHYKNIGAVNLSDSKHESLTQRFIKTYANLEQQYQGDVSEERVFNEAVEVLNAERRTDTSLSLSKAFKAAEVEATSPTGLKININELLKE